MGATDVGRDLALERLPLQSGMTSAVALLDEPERGIQQRGDVQVLDRLQPRLGALRGHFTSGVAPLVAEEAVVVVVGPGTGRDHDHRPAAGTQHPRELSQCAAIIGDVLQQVGADDGLGDAVGDRQRAGIGAQQPYRRGMLVRLAQSGADQVDAHQMRLGIRRDQVLEQVPGGAADVHDELSGCHGADTLQDRRAGPAIEKVGARGLFVQRLQAVGPVDRRIGFEIREVGLGPPPRNQPPW